MSVYKKISSFSFSFFSFLVFRPSNGFVINLRKFFNLAPFLKMCTITILNFFSLGGKGQDRFGTFLGMEKLSEIKPPLTVHENSTVILSIFFEDVTKIKILS